MHLLRTRSLLPLAGLVVLAACGDDGTVNPPGPEPASITITAGNNQTKGVNTAVDVAPQVRVLDADGAPVSNTTVTFAVTAGGGAITGATPKTSGSGYASVGSWTLGPTGGVNTLTATVAGLPAATFNATAQAPTAAPANVTLYVGGGQTAQVAAPIPAPPTVRVTSAGGQPVQFATVTFTVQAGGGSVTGGTVTTDAQGLARPTQWTLGAAPGTNTLRATVAGLPPLDVPATGVPLDAGRFNLTLRFISTITPEQYTVFEEARARWEDVIIGELSNLTVSNQPLCSGAPNATEQIDDVIIFVNLVPIDGPGSVLGSAGPCAIRTSNGLPIAGVMNFDTADLAQLATAGTLRDVILHEMGHVIGIGSLWNITSPARTLLSGEGGAEPFFTGAGAIAEFDAAGGAAYAFPKVPVENCVAPTTCSGTGQGTRDSHWRETVLGNELMTGFIGGGLNPLSRITVASLADMGYAVDPTAADGYTYSSIVRLNGGAVPLEEAPLRSPILVFDESGRVEGSIPRP